MFGILRENPNFRIGDGLRAVPFASVYSAYRWRRLDLLLKFPESYKKHVREPSLPHVLFYGIILLGLRYRSSSEKMQPQYFWR